MTSSPKYWRREGPMAPGRPGQAPRLSLGYQFRGAEVRFLMKTWGKSAGTNYDFSIIIPKVWVVRNSRL